MAMFHVFCSEWRHLAGTNARTMSASFAPPKPVITIPVKVESRAVRRQNNIRKLDRDMDKRRLEKAPLVIAAKRSEFNHRQGQTYGKFSPVPLASGGWKHKKSYGDYFTINSFKPMEAASYDRKLEKPVTDFSQLGVEQNIVAALCECGYLKPTNIQFSCLPHILNNPGSHALIAAETGNGKTLSFLLPMVQEILKLKHSLSDRKVKLNSPMGVVVSPSRELALQTGEVATRLCEHLGLTVRVALGGSVQKKILTSPREEVDILVGSFGALSKFFHEGLYSRQYVTEVALDEIDTLLDDTFKTNVLSFLQKFGHSGTSLLTGTRLLMTGATFPTNFDNYIGQVLEAEDISKFSTNQIHRVQFHVPQKFIRVKPLDKTEILRELLENDAAKQKKTIIFSNKASTADFVSLFLNENNIRCINFDKSVPWKYRQSHLDKFLSNEVNVLSATDLASRGLDTTTVNHVINFDFPLNPSDYIHRAGRVGRVGGARAAHVTSLVDHPLGVEVLNRIETAVRKNAEIFNVNSNIIRIIEHRHRKKYGRSLREEREEEGE